MFSGRYWYGCGAKTWCCMKSTGGVQVRQGACRAVSSDAVSDVEMSLPCSSGGRCMLRGVLPKIGVAFGQNAVGPQNPQGACWRGSLWRQGRGCGAVVPRWRAACMQQAAALCPRAADPGPGMCRRHATPAWAAERSFLDGWLLHASGVSRPKLSLRGLAACCLVSLCG